MFYASYLYYYNQNKLNMKIKDLSLFIIVSSYLFQITLSESLVKKGECEFVNDSGYNYDLTPLRNTLQDYKFDSFKYTYKANFCGSLVEQCPGSMTPVGLFVRRNYCIGRMTYGWDTANAEYLNHDNKSSGIKLTFGQGEKCYLGFNSYYQVIYTLKCNPYAETKLETVNKLSTCTFEYVFESKHGCATSSGGSFGSKTILMYLIIAMSCYLMLFSYLNFKQNPEDGLMKAIPHRAFWREYLECMGHGANKSVEFVKEKTEYYVNKYKEYKSGSGYE